MITTETILDTTVHGTPAGNYDGSSQDWFSDAVKAADYYRGRGGIQTIQFNLSGFQGLMTLQATLSPVAEDANWFTVYELDGTVVPVTGISSHTALGNFVWIRLEITDFQAGTINSVTITY